jgi:hypothetical protein
MDINRIRAQHSDVGGHALYSFEKELMLLEQETKRRRMMARLER